MNLELAILVSLLAIAVAATLWLCLSIRSESRKRTRHLYERFAVLELKLEAKPATLPLTMSGLTGPTEPGKPSLVLEQAEFLRALSSKV